MRDVIIWRTKYPSCYPQGNNLRIHGSQQNYRFIEDFQEKDISTPQNYEENFSR